jgi:PKD repeat protein
MLNAAAQPETIATSESGAGHIFAITETSRLRAGLDSTTRGEKHNNMRNRLLLRTGCILLSVSPLFIGGCASTSNSVNHQSGTGVSLTSIQVMPGNGSVAAGTAVQFKATGTFSDNTTQDLTNSVTWASSNTGAASISPTGMATGVSSGQTTTISAKQTSIIGSASLTVTSPTLVSIAVTPANTSMVAGTKVQFKASGTFSDNSTQDLTSTVTWTSSNTAVATITVTGLATGMTAGQTTTISAKQASLTGSTSLSVTPATLVSIAVTPASTSIAAGAKIQFKASGTFSDNSTQDLTSTVTWISSNTSVATVGATGLATGVTSGQTTTISANDASVIGSTSLSVTAPTLVSVAVTPSNSSMVAGTTVQFTATGTFSDNSTQNLTSSVIWSSSNTTAATINANGLATGVTSGQTTTISAKQSSITGSTNLTVTAATLISIAVTPSNSSVVAGTTLQFTATGTFSNNSTQNLTSSVTWSSSNTTAATINASGLATGVTSGQTTTISAKQSSITGSTNLTVTAATLISIAVTPSNSSVAAGTTLQFTATGTFSNNSTQNLTSSVTWSSSNTTAATINASGLATGVTSGQTTTISAKQSSVTGSTNLTVTAATLISIAVTPNNSSVAAGTTLQFTATGTFSNNSTQNLTSSVTWSSSNTTAATIDASGLATDVTSGQSTTISAKQGSITGSTTLTVTLGAGPTAVITASPKSGTAALTVALSGASSTDPSGTITSYAWNFGDGQTSTLVSPSHTYSVVGTYTVSLTVTDNGGRQGSTTTSITVSSPSSYAGVYRIISGAGPYTDTKGQVWQADAGFNTGDVSTTTSAISGTTDPALYQSERVNDPSEAQLEYQLPVANGTYLVNLYFAETDAASEGSGLRVFDVDFQGLPAIGNLDIYGAVGANAALMKSAVVSVSNGILTIDFVRVVGNPKIDAIEVREVSAHDTSLLKTSWKVISVDSEESDTLDGSALNAIDNNGSTFWITQINNNGGGNAPGYPHAMQVDLGKSYPLSGFQYLPRQDGSTAGRIAQYNFYVSTDGVNWGSPVASGTFASTALQKQISFTPVNARYVQLQALSEVNGNIWASMAELGVLFACSTTPSVAIMAPVDEYLQSSGASLTTTALACLDPVQNAGWGVQFTLDGANPIKVYTLPSQTTYTGLSKTEHVIDAYVINSAGTVVTGTGTHDQVKQIGIGDYYVSMGDSVTWGQNGTQKTSSDGRDVSPGYQPLLNNQLTSFKNYPQEVSDEGVPGTTSAEGLENIPAVLNKHPGSQTFLVMFGMNDARPWLPVPSGQGLNPGDSGYAGSYKDNMQQIINALKSAGKKVALAKTNVALADCADNIPTDPGYCAPYSNLSTGARNVLIQQYNPVVDELVSNTANGITVTPPDFYNYFLGTYQTQYSDNIHPNDTGYMSMATLWLQALTQ